MVDRMLPLSTVESAGDDGKAEMELNKHSKHSLSKDPSSGRKMIFDQI